MFYLWLPSSAQQPGVVPHPPDEKQISIYSPQANYTLPVVSRPGIDYVGLLEVLEPLGRVDAKWNGSKWKLKFEERDAQFEIGNSRARIGKSEIDLSVPFIAANGRGLAPLAALPRLLAEFLPGHSITFHEQARRLFLDQAQIRYGAEFKNTENGVLVLNFSAPVNPFIGTEPGKVKMLFRHQPLVANSGKREESFDFHNPFVPSMSFSEENGAAELVINTTRPMLASFSPDRKFITIAPVTPAPAPQTQVAAIPAPGNAPEPAVAVPPPRGFLVVIDAAHGGEDKGGAITDRLVEKDLDLAIARRLHAELQTRGVASHLLRDNDATLSFDQRAWAANTAVPSLYLAIHSTGSGSGLHLFTSDIAAASPRNAFLPWGTAQSASVTASHTVAGAVAMELLKHDVPVLDLTAAVAPLNSIASPALALELAAPAGKSSAALTSPLYQQTVCSAIADAVVQIRGRLPRGEATP